VPALSAGVSIWRLSWPVPVLSGGVSMCLFLIVFWPLLLIDFSFDVLFLIFLLHHDFHHLLLLLQKKCHFGLLFLPLSIRNDLFLHV
jgi:hypothetical protein